MAFAKRQLPLVVGAEPLVRSPLSVQAPRILRRAKSCDVWRHDLRAMHCLPRRPRQPLRKCRRHHGLPHRRVCARPHQSARATCNSRALKCFFARCGLRSDSLRHVEHMLFDNAKLKPGETVLVHAGGSGIGSVAIKMAKALGCTVITTSRRRHQGRESQSTRRGSRHQLQNRAFEGVTRKLTAKKGVDVVFEHVGGEGFNGSLLCLKRGGRLVHLQFDRRPHHNNQFDAIVSAAVQDPRIIRGVDARHPRQPFENSRGHRADIDTEVALKDFEHGLARLESQQVFGKVIVNF